MAFKIITGRSKSGKSRYIYDKIKEYTNCGREVILIVPEQYTHAAERRLLETVGAIKDNSIEVLSFMRLAHVTEKRLGLYSNEKIDAVGKALIVSDILKNGEFKYFKSVSGQNGFVDLCVKTVGEFKKYMLSPQTLSDSSRQTDDEALSMKLSDLSNIFDEYEKKIQDKYSDSDDALTILAKHLSDNEIYKDKYIFLDEFSNFVPQELSVISQLAAKCMEVNISLCCDFSDKNSVLFMPSVDTIAALKSSIAEKAEIIKLADSHFTSNDLTHLEKNLYKFPLEKCTSPSGDVKIFSAQNPYCETESTAVSIMKLVQNHNYRFADIAVICPDLDAYGRHIERIFDMYNIPYFMDTKSDILNHHIIRFVLSLLDVYINDYSYESIFGYLKTAFLAENPEDICILENYILKTGIRKNSWLDNNRWNTFLNRIYDEDSSERKALNGIREKSVLPLAKMHEKIKGRHSVRDNISELYGLLNTLGIRQTLEKYIREFEENGEIKLKKEYEQIWDIIIESFSKILLICGDKIVNVTEFRNLLYTAFSQYQIGFIPSSVDSVLIGNTERTHADGVKALFVLGVNEGIFPVVPKADGVLTDRDKKHMKDIGVNFSTTSDIAAYYSQFAAYRAFTIPSEKLFVSYSCTGNDFKPLRKSYIISRICTVMSENEQLFDIKSLENQLISPKRCREHLADAVAEYEQFGHTDAVWKNIYNYFKTDGNFTHKLEKFDTAVNIPQQLNRDRLSLLTGDNEYTSVSRIQRYMACRYSYFMDYILNVTEKKDTLVDSLDVGNITHSILEKLCRIIEANGGFKAVGDDFLHESIDEMLSEFTDSFINSNDSMNKRNIYIIKRLNRSVFTCIKAIQNHIVNSMFEPLGYEMEFKDNSDLGCIEIKLSSGKTVKLTGKIDRADIYRSKDGDFIRIVDYKTGSKTFKLEDVFYGLDVQLIVYLNAFVNSKSTYRHGGALYFLIDDPMVSAKGKLDDKEISKKLDSALKLNGIIANDKTVLEGYDEKTAAIRNKYSIENFKLMDVYLEKMLKNICTDMVNGDISINPYKKSGKSPCDYCKYMSVCRFDSSSETNSYNYLESIDKPEDIWTKMEVDINVDDQSAAGN